MLTAISSIFHQQLRRRRGLCSTLLLCLLLSSCVKHVGPTDVRILDPDRHYFSVVQGEDVRMAYRLINTGRRPLIITDIQPAATEIELYREAPRMIPPKDSVTLQFVYHTDRNIAYTEHKIRIFGNIGTINGVHDSINEGVAILRFDIHIVRPTVDQSDYEERYYAKRPKWEEMVDGTHGEQGYYTDEDILERWKEIHADDEHQYYEAQNK